MLDECLASTITLDPHCILYYLHFMDEVTHLLKVLPAGEWQNQNLNLAQSGSAACHTFLHQIDMRRKGSHWPA